MHMIRSACLWLLLCPVAYAQLDVTSTTQERRYTVSVVKIDAPDTAQLSVSAENVNRQPVQFLKLDDRSYEIQSTEKSWVRVTLIDFEKKQFAEKTIVVDPTEDFVPDPSPDPEPNPDAKYDGPNEFGLGLLSYNTAPKYNEAVAKTYNAAASFLFGHPELKVIGVESSDPRAGTDYVVTVWLEKQMVANNVDADPDWRRWYTTVMAEMQRLNRSGKIVNNRNWYDAFREIAAGVEAKR